MVTLREELRQHQKATDCSDDRMVSILCDFIQKLDDDGTLEAPWYEWLLEFVVDNLELGPGDIPLPDWQNPELFTDEERETMMEVTMEEVTDCKKEIARDMLDNEELVQLILYVDDDIEVTCELLLEIAIGSRTMAELEIARNPNEVNPFNKALDFIKRFKLVESDDVSNRLTELGEEYFNRNR